MVPKKFVPVMNTVVPVPPLFGVKLAIVGHPAGTEKLDGLVAVPFEVSTVTRPVVAPSGTIAKIRVGDSMVKVVATPLNLTLAVPDRFVPVIVTLSPGHPLVGFNEVTVGEAVVVTVKDDELVTGPLGVTTVIGPLEAPVGTVAVTCESEFTVNPALVPAKLTDVAPEKPVPVITTEVPTGPLVGLNDAIAGHPVD